MGQILGRSIFEYIDANETVEISYMAFLFEILHHFQGIVEINFSDGTLELIKNRDRNPRIFCLELGAPF